MPATLLAECDDRSDCQLTGAANRFRSASTTAMGDTISSTIDLDLPCAACGYNLKTLSRDGVCPECGASALASWDAYVFHHSELGQLRANGLPWLRAMRGGVTSGLLAWLLSFVGVYFGLSTNFFRPPRGIVGGICWLTPLITLYVVSCRAAWVLMTPRVRKHVSQISRTFLVVEICAVAFMFFNWRVVQFYGSFFYHRVGFRHDDFGLFGVVQSIGCYASLSWPFATTATFGRLTQLAWMARRRGVAVSLGMIGVLPAGLAAYISLMLASAGQPREESRTIAVYLVGPTGTLPALWAMLVFLLRSLQHVSFADMSDVQSLVNIGASICIFGSALALGFLLFAIRKTLTRAILLSEESEASSRS